MKIDRVWMRALGTLLVAVLAASCDDNGTMEPETGSVEGTVVDESDAGVAGVAVTLARGGETLTATSGADGGFTFADVEAGAWQADLTAPAGFLKDPSVTFPVSVSVTANQTANVTLPLVAEAEPGSISGTVSADGAGVEGATLTLTLPGGGTEEADSDADGAYAFEDLEAGDYTVEVTPPEGYGLADEETGTRDITLEEGADETADFELSELPAGSISGTVSADEAGVEGATLTLTLPGGGTEETMSDADGAYAFEGLAAGDYTVTVTPPEGYAVAEGETDTRDVTLEEDGEATADFELTEIPAGTASISGTVSADEAGVENATLTLTLPGGATREATSDADGAYAFEELAAGDYAIAVTPPEGYELAEGETGTRDVTLEEDEGATADFELQEVEAGAGMISGTVANGPNAIAGVTVELSGAGDAEATTDAEGMYTFEGLQDGDYQVSVVLDADRAAAEEDGESQEVTITDGSAATADFAVVRVVQIVDFAFESDDVDILTGSTVRWVNTTNTAHTITPDGHSEWSEASTSQPETALEVTFDEAGTFDYFCVPHQEQGMDGTITVTDPEA